MAFETLHEHRDDIAYKVRFDSTAGRGTKVTFLTEGILLRMLTADPKLPQYQVVIIDEVSCNPLRIIMFLMPAQGQTCFVPSGARHHPLHAWGMPQCD